MMEHFKILGFVVILMLGVLSVTYVLHINNRFSARYLIYLVKYTVTTNLAFAIIFLYHYFSQNLPEGTFDPGNIYIKGLTDILTNLIGVLSVYYLSGLILSIRGISITSACRITVFSFITLVSMLFVFRMLGVGNSWLGPLLRHYSHYISNNLVFLEILILLVSLVTWRKASRLDTGVINTFFSLIYLLGYVLTFTIAIFLPMILVSNSVRQVAGLLVLAYFNLAPGIWVRYFYLPYARQMKKLISDKTDIQGIMDQHHITKREGEIVALILEGKSNNEIQARLFISFHTVKNHLSNIYRKFRVNSRHELVHFFVKQMK